MEVGKPITLNITLGKESQKLIYCDSNNLKKKGHFKPNLNSNTKFLRSLRKLLDYCMTNCYKDKPQQTAV